MHKLIQIIIVGAAYRWERLLPTAQMWGPLFFDFGPLRVLPMVGPAMSREISQTPMFHHVSWWNHGEITTFCWQQNNCWVTFSPRHLALVTKKNPPVPPSHGLSAHCSGHPSNPRCHRRSIPSLETPRKKSAMAKIHAALPPDLWKKKSVACWIEGIHSKLESPPVVS